MATGIADLFIRFIRRRTGALGVCAGFTCR
jgi:hypothetical protein